MPTSACHQGHVQFLRYWLPSVPPWHLARPPERTGCPHSLAQPCRLPLEGAEAEPTRAESGDDQRLGMPSLSLGLTGPWVTVTGLRKRQRHRAGNHHGSGDRASSAPFIFPCLCKRDGIRTCFISGVSMRVKWGCPQEPWALCWAGKVLNKRITNDWAGVGVEDCPVVRRTADFCLYRQG